MLTDHIQDALGTLGRALSGWDSLRAQFAQHLSAGDCGPARTTLEMMEAIAHDTAAKRCVAEYRVWVELLDGRLRQAELVRERRGDIYRPTLLVAALLRHLRVCDEDSLAELGEQVHDAPSESYVMRALMAFGRAADAVEIYAPRGLDHEVVHRASAILFHAGHYEPALALCDAGHAHYGIGLHAFNAACCLAKLERPEEAIARLRLALASDYETDFDDPDLTSLRSRQDFQTLQTKRSDRGGSDPSSTIE